MTVWPDPSHWHFGWMMVEMWCSAFISSALHGGMMSTWMSGTFPVASHASVSRVSPSGSATASPPVSTRRAPALVLRESGLRTAAQPPGECWTPSLPVGSLRCPFKGEFQSGFACKLLPR